MPSLESLASPISTASSRKERFDTLKATATKLHTLKLYHNIVQFVWICFCLCAAFTERIIRRIYICVTQLFPSSFQFILKVNQALNMQSMSLLVTLLFLFYIHSFVAVWSVCIMCILSACSQPNDLPWDLWSCQVSRSEFVAPWWCFSNLHDRKWIYTVPFFNWRLS